MPIRNLTTPQIRWTTKRGLINDGAGLYLQIGKGGSKSWVFRYAGKDGRKHDHGLGPFHTIGLSEARRRGRQSPPAAA
jgi:Arm DNA-binding domain